MIHKFHDSAVNETVTLPLQNPAGATSVTLDFRYFDATNNWWWALDDIKVYTGASARWDGVLRAIIDRNTSNVKIVNNTGAAVSLRGYSLRLRPAHFNEPNAVFKADSAIQLGAVHRPECDRGSQRGPQNQFRSGNGGTDRLWQQRLAEVSTRTRPTLRFIFGGRQRQPHSGDC